MTLFNESINIIEKNRVRLIDGKQNCIPNPFPRLRKDWAGIEQKQYYMVTASSKVGKSQITDFLFLYHPVEYVISKKTNYDIKVLYFSLEMSKEQKMLQAISYFMHYFHKITISPKELRSLNRVLDNDTYTKVKELEPFFNEYLTKVKYIDNVRNRYGIWLEILHHAKENGKIIYETRNFDGKDVQVMTDYIPNNPDLITIIVLDHIGLLNPESGKDLFSTIGEISSTDFIKARNIFKFSPVIVQQQMASQESLEHKKADALMPSLAGLADNKATQRDINVAFGLFSPHRYEIKNWKGYDISKLGNRFRALEILADREGESNIITPLYFKGECSYFEELPLPNTKEYQELIL